MIRTNRFATKPTAKQTRRRDSAVGRDTGVYYARVYWCTCLLNLKLMRVV